MFRFIVLFFFVNFSLFKVSAQEVDNQQKICRFRKHLINHFASLNDGRKINFNDERIDRYSKILPEKLRKFLNDRQNLDCTQFHDSCFDYLKGAGNKVNVLNRGEFEKLVSSPDKQCCRLYVGIKSNVFADEFKKGQIFSDRAKKYSLSEKDAIVSLKDGRSLIEQLLQRKNSGYSQYCNGEFPAGYSGLCLFENFDDALLDSREFNEGQLVFPGFIGEVAVGGLNAIDFKTLDEVLTVVKYDHPQEFGLCDEIEHYFNEDDEQRLLKELKSQESVEHVYDSVAEIIYRNSNRIYDELNELFKQRTGKSFKYADVSLKFDFNQKSEYENRISEFCSDCFGKSIFDLQILLGFEGSFVNNKTLALMKNYSVVAKLLGFDAIKFDMGPYKIKRSGRDVCYYLVNTDKIEAVCFELEPSGCDKYEAWRVPVGCC